MNDNITTGDAMMMIDPPAPREFDWLTEDDTEELAFSEQLEDALYEQLEESERLIKAHSQQFPITTQYLVSKAISDPSSQVTLDWVIKVSSGAQESGQKLEDVLGCQAIYKFAVKYQRHGFFMDGLDLNSGQSLRISCSQNPTRKLYASSILRYLNDKKEDIVWLVKTLRWLGEDFALATLCLSVASAGYLGLLCEIISAVDISRSVHYYGDTGHRQTFYNCIFGPLFSLSQKNGWTVHLPDVYEAVRQDERYPCQYFATVLGARLGKWEEVLTAVKTGAVTLLAGAEDVIVRALKRRAWAVAGHVLLSVMMVKGISDSLILIDIQYKVGIRFLPRYSALAGCFVQHCQRLKLYAVGALFAAWCSMWKVLEAQLCYMEQGINDNANCIVLKAALNRRKFKMVYNWMQRPTQRDLWPEYVNVILSDASADSGSCAGARALVEQLMERCHKKVLLGLLLFKIVEDGQIDLLRKFLGKGLLLRCDIPYYALNSAVDNLKPSNTRQHTIDESKRRYQILLMCLEAGIHVLLYKKKSPLSTQAVLRLGQIPILRLFYLTGICSSSSLHSKLPEFETDDYYGLPRDKTQAVEFLKQIVDTPRTLHNQCCINISQLLGCGADRKERALGLGLPLSVTRQVLFLDVLYPATTENSQED